MKQCSYGGISNIVGNTNEYFTFIKLQLLELFFQFALSSIITQRIFSFNYVFPEILDINFYILLLEPRDIWQSCMENKSAKLCLWLIIVLLFSPPDPKTLSGSQQASVNFFF